MESFICCHLHCCNWWTILQSGYWYSQYRRFSEWKRNCRFRRSLDPCSSRFSFTHDSRFIIFLWRNGREEECNFYNASKFHCSWRNFYFMDCCWFFPFFWRISRLWNRWRSLWSYRKSFYVSVFQSCKYLSSQNDGFYDSVCFVCTFSDEICGDYSGFDYRIVCRKSSIYFVFGFYGFVQPFYLHTALPYGLASGRTFK